MAATANPAANDPAAVAAPTHKVINLARVWWVETSPGSQPWSAVNMNTSSGRMAAKISGRRRDVRAGRELAVGGDATVLHAARAARLVRE